MVKICAILRRMMTLRGLTLVWRTVGGIGLLLVYVGLLLLNVQPLNPLAQSYGLYAPEGDTLAYRWSSNRAIFPLRSGTGPTLVALALGDSRWPGRSSPQVTLASSTDPLTTMVLVEGQRRYSLLLPPRTAALRLMTSVARPSVTDARWLGVQVYGMRVTTSGWPLAAALQALGWTVLAGLIGLLLLWSVRRDQGWLVGLLLLAFVLRIISIGRTPPGFSQDEAVSLIDAWHLVRTGHDHLGNGWPLGAQEALGDWISPLLTYLELPLVAILGPGVLVGRVVMALVGTLGVLFSYKVARLLGYSTLAALAAGLVAAVSPWQVFLQRFALPPALVPTSWIVCLWAALLFLRSGQARAATRFAGIAGIALYAYPTLKLAIPLLVGWTTLLAFHRHGWRSARRWLVPALLLAVLWLPFADLTLLQPASNTRLNQVVMHAESPGTWLANWWAGYRVYWEPAFYFAVGDHDPIHGLPEHGEQLLVEAPLVLLGLGALLWQCSRALKAHLPRKPPGSPGLMTMAQVAWLCIAGALLIAPLPASLTFPSPHAWRAASVAPMYALLVGLGVAVLAAGFQRMSDLLLRRIAQIVVIGGLSGVLLWQVGRWWQTYVTTYPPTVAWVNQDGLMETIRRAEQYAPQFDYISISTDDITEPYVYLLAAQPLPPAQAQAALVVERRPGHLNAIHQLGPYEFESVAQIPLTQPILEAVPDQFGGPGFVLQARMVQGQRVLLLRRMQ